MTTTPEHLIDSAVPQLVAELLPASSGQLYRGAVALLERSLLAHILAMTGGNQLRAARVLGLNRNTLRKRCRALKLDPRGHRRAAEATP